MQLGNVAYTTEDGKNINKTITFNPSTSLSALEETCKKNGIHPLDIDCLNAGILKKIASNQQRILQSLKSIVHKICKELGLTRIIETGSSFAGVQVGLPLEADFIVLVPNAFKSMEDFCNDVENTLAKTIFKERDWRFLGMERHRAGMCVILEYQSTVGVSFDIVPIQILGQPKASLTRIFDRHVLHFLKHYKLNQEFDADIVKLLRPYDCEYDTGILENKLLQRLEYGKKSGYCVAKYLIQNHICDEGGRFDKRFGNQKISRFGYKPILKRFYLRVFFFHLLVETFGTPIYDILNEGVLTLCLLDMMKKVFSVAKDKPSGTTTMVFAFYHPLQNHINPLYKLQMPFAENRHIRDGVRCALQKYFKAATSQDISHYKLLNYPRSGHFIGFKTKDENSATKNAIIMGNNKCCVKSYY